MLIRKHLAHLFVLGAGFVGIFSAYLATQNLETSVVPSVELGNFAVGSVYVGLLIGTLVVCSQA